MTHEKYDTSNIKTITLNGKKYIEMAVIENIRTMVQSMQYAPCCNVEMMAQNLAYHNVLDLIDKMVKGGENNAT